MYDEKFLPEDHHRPIGSPASEVTQTLVCDSKESKAR
jgi:hypothetical protein